MCEPRLGKLKNGNRPAPVTHAWAAPRCGAQRKYDGQPCQGMAMANGRCRLHGGKSTGPRTKEGRECIRQAQLRHGLYTKESIDARRAGREAMKTLGLKMPVIRLVARSPQPRDPATGRFVRAQQR